ncbi:MAG: lambda-exonuclease family protein [Micrococcaceae bacterium]
MSNQHPTFKPTPAQAKHAPGTPEWARTVSASKIPAILGISPWDSAYSLWSKATGRVTGDTVNEKAVERGNALEAALLLWCESKLENSRVRPALSYVHPENPGWFAAPDGLVFEGKRRTPYAIVEAKTAMRGDDWGEEGTAVIPPGYLSQVAWQFYVTGARLAYVPALVNMTLRLHVVTWEDVADDIADIIATVQAWEHCVATDTAPAWDGSDATLQAVRDQHPNIDPDLTVEISHDLAQNLQWADQEAKDADARLKRWKSEVLDLAGDAKTITDPDGVKVAGRQARGTSKPFLTITKPKTTITAPLAA